VRGWHASISTLRCHQLRRRRYETHLGDASGRRRRRRKALQDINQRLEQREELKDRDELRELVELVEQLALETLGIKCALIAAVAEVGHIVECQALRRTAKRNGPLRSDVLLQPLDPPVDVPVQLVLQADDVPAGEGVRHEALLGRVRRPVQL